MPDPTEKDRNVFLAAVKAAVPKEVWLRLSANKKLDAESVVAGLYRVAGREKLNSLKLTEPVQTITDALAVLNCSDEHARKVFFEHNQQSDPGSPPEQSHVYASNLMPTFQQRRKIYKKLRETP